MSELLDTLRALIRDELSRIRPPELGVVSRTYPREGDDDPNNHQINVKLLASGVELQRVPLMVSRLGISALPREGDLLLVAFLGGALNAPIALGCVYDSDRHPPQAAQDEVVYKAPDAAQSGVRRLHLEIPSGATLTLDDDALVVALGDTTLTLNRDGDVAIHAKGNLQLTADGDIDIEASGNLNMSAQQNAALKAISVKVEGQSEAKVKGAQLALAGITQFSPS